MHSAIKQLKSNHTLWSKNAEQAQLVLTLCQGFKKKRCKWLWKSAHHTRLLKRLWIESVTKVTPVWATRKMSLNTVGNWRVWSARINAICNLRKNRGAALPQVTENVNAGHDHTVSARTVRRQLHREGYYNRAAVHKPLITEMNAHLEFGGAKKTTGIHRDVEKGDAVKWVILRLILHQWARVARVVHSERMVQVWLLDPYSEGIRWLCYAVGGHVTGMVLVQFPIYRVGSLSISTKLFWAITFPLWWNISILMEVLSLTVPPSIEHTGSLNGLMSMRTMWIICRGLHSRTGRPV